MGCCKSISIIRKRLMLIDDNSYHFPVTLVYCEGCGQVKSELSIIRDGLKIKTVDIPTESV